MSTTIPAVAASRRGRLFRRAAVALLVVAVAGYFGGSYLYDHWHMRAAVRAERDRDFAAADRHLAVWLSHAPDDPEGRLLAARLGWRPDLGDPPPAPGWDDPLRAHLKVAATAPDLIDRVGREEDILDVLAGRLDPAANRLAKRVKDGDPDAVPILEALAWANVVAHRFPAAAAAIDLLLDRCPDHAPAYYWRGLVRELTHGATGRPDDDYRRAVELAPGRPTYRLRLAYNLARNHDTRAEALAVYAGLAADRPDDPDVLFGLGTCQLDTGDAATARETLGRAVALRPADGGGLAEYGRAVLECGDPAAAEPVLRQAVGLAPNSRAANFGLGTCLARLGREAEAKPYLDAAVRIVADVQRVHELSRELFKDPAAGAARRCELGQLLVRTGRPDLGRYWLESAVEADPRYEPARAALAALGPGG